MTDDDQDQLNGQESEAFEDADEVAPTMHPDYNPAANDPMRLDNLGRRARNRRRRYFIHGESHPDIINPDGATDAVRIKFLGCNSLYITDGTTNILIDPFFSRPEANMDWESSRSLMIQPDRGIIERTLEYAGITEVDAIFMSHAHWDHAQDVAPVWHALNSDNPRTMIYGSTSIQRITNGHVERRGNEVTPNPVPDEFLETEVRNRILDFGEFRIAVIPGEHGPLPRSSYEAGIGDIPEDLTPPARVDAYKQGPMYDFLIQHNTHGTILNKGSANFIPGLLQNLMDAHAGERNGESEQHDDANVDVAIIAIAGYTWLWGRYAITMVAGAIHPALGHLIDHYFGGLNSGQVHRHFWDEIIRPTNPYLVLFNHWDRFTDGRCDLLDRPPEWMTGAKAIGIFRRRRRRERSRYRTGTRHLLRNRPMPIHYFPFWDEITVLPIHRRPSLFRLPEGDRLPELAEDPAQQNEA